MPEDAQKPIDQKQIWEMLKEKKKRNEEYNRNEFEN